VILHTEAWRGTYFPFPGLEHVCFYNIELCNDILLIIGWLTTFNGW